MKQQNGHIKTPITEYKISSMKISDPNNMVNWKVRLFAVFNILYSLYLVYFALICIERAGTALVFAAMYFGVASVLLWLTSDMMHKERSGNVKWQALISLLIILTLFNEYLLEYLVKPEPNIYAYEHMWLISSPAEYQDNRGCCGFQTVTCLHVVESQLCQAPPAGLPCARPEDDTKYGSCDAQFIAEHDQYWWRIASLILYEPMIYVRFVVPFLVYLGLALSLILTDTKDKAVLPFSSKMQSNQQQKL